MKANYRLRIDNIKIENSSFNIKKFGAKLMIYIISLFPLFMYTQSIIEHNISSNNINEERKIKVRLPKNYTAQQTYPVIYTLDSNYLFNLTRASVEFLSREWYDVIPQVIVVGICYKTDEFRYDIGMDLESGELNEHGKNFKNYIVNEVIPFVNTEYSTCGYETLLGHSYTATYALHQYAFRKNNTIDSYIAIAPETMKIPLYLPFYNSSDVSSRIFVATGAADAPRRVDLVKKLETQHKNKLHLTAKFRVIDGEDHNSVIPRAIDLGLRNIYSSYANSAWIDKRIAKDSLSDAHQLLLEAIARNDSVYQIDRIRVNNYNASGLLWHAADFNDIQTFEKVTSYFLNNPSDKKGYILNYVADGYYTLGDMKKAAYYYSEALNILTQENESLFYVYNMLYKIREKQQKYSDAWDCMDMAIKDLQHDSDMVLRAKLNQGKLSANFQTHIEEGIEKLNDCIAQDYKIAKANLYLGKIYKTRKEYKRSREHILKALKQDSTLTEAKNLLKSI